jgi:hypothetical protein
MSLREVDLNEPVELSGVRSVSAQTNAARMHRLFSGPRATQSLPEADILVVIRGPDGHR